jgi:(p)ppGpp synthase/HD superfamily hydrolase
MQWASFSAALSYLPAREQERIRKAFELGATMHEGQKRRSGEPYFTHPIAVATILAGMAADGDTIIAALLHDTVEDTDLKLDTIDQEFNGSVRNLIDGVTKLFSGDFNDKPIYVVIIHMNT